MFRLTEEISAFMSLKGALVVMLETGDNALCRTKIQHILAVWQHKTKVSQCMRERTHTL